MSEWMIDDKLPAGNIILQKIQGNRASVIIDLRDTEEEWFYWKFRSVFPRAGEYQFVFTGGQAIGSRGPAYSTDKGKSWRYLGLDTTERNPDRFTYEYDGNPEKNEVYFCMAIPYLQENLDSFLHQHENSPYLRKTVHCRTPKGRETERIEISGNTADSAKKNMLITCRHHACEMTASYVAEGIMNAALEDSETGEKFRRLYHLTVVPFMDKDGVEDGDQGKQRMPHDHNRDYWDKPIYASTAENMNLLRERNISVILDIHCPWLHDIGNPHGTAELVHFLWPDRPECLSAAKRFGSFLEQEKPDEIIYKNSDGLDFNTTWNKFEFTDKHGFPFNQWCSRNGYGEFALSIEIPYSKVYQLEFTPDAARTFGRAMARQLIRYAED